MDLLRLFGLKSDISVADTDILAGLTDNHCHLLPGVDDGVKTIEESLSILSDMESAGVKEVWMTPHIMEDVPNTTEVLTMRFEHLKSVYKGGISIHLAAEYMMDEVLEQRLNKQDLLVHSEDSLLVETISIGAPYDMKSILQRIMSAGLFPILAHPERYMYMRQSDYVELKEMGVRFQLNLPSLCGQYGKEVKMKAEKLLSSGMYDMCGSDTHSMKRWEFIKNGSISKSCIQNILKIKTNRESE